ncbi:MAG: PTS sugar transporter subunit IIA [Kiritimatiellaeota bacterium]|nr:PTS sugar transporter subunit IIA [Kiritimatiellota bacterium]
MIDLKTLLPRHHVLLQVASATRADIFRELATPLDADGIVTDLDRFVFDLEQRERQITTQVEQGIAFPHARSAVARSLGLTVGIASEPGLVFSETREPVRLLFLIAVPAFAPTAHLPLLQRLAAFAHDPTRTQRLLACRTPGQIASTLARFKFKAP